MIGDLCEVPVNLTRVGWYYRECERSFLRRRPILGDRRASAVAKPAQASSGDGHFPGGSEGGSPHEDGSEAEAGDAARSDLVSRLSAATLRLSASLELEVEHLRSLPGDEIARPEHPVRTLQGTPMRHRGADVGRSTSAVGVVVFWPSPTAPWASGRPWRRSSPGSAPSSAGCTRRPTSWTSCPSGSVPTPRACSTRCTWPTPARRPRTPATASGSSTAPATRRPPSVWRRTATCCSPSTTSRPPTGCTCEPTAARRFRPAPAGDRARRGQRSGAASASSGPTHSSSSPSSPPPAVAGASTPAPRRR